MARGKNAQLAVDLFVDLLRTNGWKAHEAWKGIAVLLLTCQVYRGKWEDFHQVVVYRESNDFKVGKAGIPNAVIQRAERLTQYLAGQLGVKKGEVCSRIGRYWVHPQISGLQPHNPVGHAFRSIVVEALRLFGSHEIEFAEEVDPHKEFPGHSFKTRSGKPKIDIVARRGGKTVALLSARWRYRHDRVDLIDEAFAYLTPARRTFPDCRFFGVIGELSPARLSKVLEQSPPENPTGPITAAVHFNPALISEGLNENGRIQHLRSLEWLIEETHHW